MNTFDFLSKKLMFHRQEYGTIADRAYSPGTGVSGERVLGSVFN